MACCKSGRHIAPGSEDTRADWWADNNGDAAMLGPSVDLWAAGLAAGPGVESCRAKDAGEKDLGGVRSPLEA